MIKANVISGAKAENGCLTNIIIKCSYNIVCRIDLFSAFQTQFSNTPVFHHSVRLIKKRAVINIIISINYRNSETFKLHP